MVTMDGTSDLKSFAGHVLLKPLMWGYAGAAFYLIADWALLSWLPALLMRRHGFEAAAAGNVCGLVTTASGVLSPVIGVRMSDFLRRRFGAQGRFLAPAIALSFCLPGSLLLLSANFSIVIAGALVLSIAIFAGACSFSTALQDLLPIRILPSV